MITFYNKQKPASESLIGKYAFADGGMHYASYSAAIMVTREMGVSVEGLHLCRTIEDGVMVATEVDEHELKTMRKTSVACACDTLDEVNAIYRANFESRSLYQASIAAGKELFVALDGTEIQPSTTFENRTPKP
ncbi:hypothetical protein [Rhizobium sp. BK176]|uniref:hypothetical protein n=1 Tax=Rhizobium sp. BK176 TaxID=2587071 RepID=UPI002169835F|nr:hypothetical protein [Rhizobium sp. BK176]MCS4088701.1 hypothetical protein [Rhizobium sp. BK176]